MSKIVKLNNGKEVDFSKLKMGKEISFNEATKELIPFKNINKNTKVKDLKIKERDFKNKCVKYEILY